MDKQKRYNDFNEYLRKEFKTRVQKITVDAGLSCPNRDGKISYGGCIFCNAEGSGTNAFSCGKTITEQIKIGKEAMIKRYKAEKFLIYFQSFSNTYAPFETLKKLYDEALSEKDVIGISIGTRPDCISDKILNLLENYAKKYLVWLEYGIQSVHNLTLEKINRGHNFETFVQTLEKTKDRGIKICAHIIIGLPNESKKEILETAKKIADLEIDGIKIHLLYVVKNTKLASLYLNQEYECLSQDEYVDITASFLELLPPTMIIQRLTVDPHPKDLIAPLWAYRKSETLYKITETLKKRNTFQGSLYLKSSS